MENRLAYLLIVEINDYIILVKKTYHVLALSLIA